jgi:uncharacterized protein with HEPN domain
VIDRDHLYLTHVLEAIENARAFTVEGRQAFIDD